MGKGVDADRAVTKAMSLVDFLTACRRPAQKNGEHAD